MEIKDLTVEEIVFGADGPEIKPKGEAERQPKGNPNREEGAGDSDDEVPSKKNFGTDSKKGGEESAFGKEDSEEEGGEDSGEDGEGAQAGEAGDGGGEPTMIEEVVASFGLKSEDLGDITDDVDGLQTVAAHVADSMVRSQISEFYKKNPAIARLQNHLENGGDERSYFEKLYSGIPDSAAYDIKTENGQRQICIENAIRKGNSREDAEALVDLWREKGDLESKAKSAKKEIDDVQKQRLQDAEAEAEEERQQIEAERQKDISEMKRIFSSGDLGSFRPSKAELVAFQRWMFVKGADGKTARERMVESQSMVARMAAEFAIFKGFKNLPFAKGDTKGDQAAQDSKRSFTDRRRSSAAAEAQTKTKKPKLGRVPDLSGMTATQLLGIE